MVNQSKETWYTYKPAVNSFFFFVDRNHEMYNIMQKERAYDQA